MLNFQFCRPATYYFICYIGILCSRQINDDDKKLIRIMHVFTVYFYRSRFGGIHLLH